MKSRIFHRSSALLYRILLLSSLTPVTHTWATVTTEPPLYQDKWEIFTSDRERISRIFITSQGTHYILNESSDTLYKNSRNNAVQTITLASDEGYQNRIQSRFSMLGSDSNMYLANHYGKKPSISSPDGSHEELAIYRLSPQGEQPELLLNTECQNKAINQCGFITPLQVSEKNNAVYGIRKDGNSSLLTQVSLDGSSKNWHEIRFDSIVKAQVISSDESQLYLQSHSHFYVVDLTNGTIISQNVLPPELAEETLQNPLTLKSDGGNRVFGVAHNKLFRLNLFNSTSPFELVWVREMNAVQDLALPPERDILYVWDENGTLNWVTKSEGQAIKQLRTMASIKKMLFDATSGWAYILDQKFWGKELRIFLLSPNGRLNHVLFSFSADYSRLEDADISVQGRVLSIGVEGKVFHYDLSSTLDFSESGKTLAGYTLPGATTTFGWGITKDCDICPPAEAGELTIDNANTTMLNQYHWPLALAEHVNKNSDLLRIGEKDENGVIRPLASVYRNKIWVFNRYKDEGLDLEQQVTSHPERVSAWRLNAAQPAITAERDLVPGSKIEVTVTLPDGSNRPLPVFTVTRGSPYLWPADLARFITQQADQLNLPIAAGERLQGDEFSFPSSHYRNMLWVPASTDYRVQYRVRP